MPNGELVEGESPYRRNKMMIKFNIYRNKMMIKFNECISSCTLKGKKLF